MSESGNKSELDAQFEAAIEADDMDGARDALDAIEDVAQTPNESGAAAFTDEALGLGGFEPILDQLSSAQIAALQIDIPKKDDLSAMYLPGKTVVDADHRIHLTGRGDVKRAARGLAIAAASGVDLASKVIMSNSGRNYTIEDGVCLELKRTEQPDMSGNVAILEQKVACKGHLEYASNGSGPTGGQHIRCLHQWALMFELGFYVTASKQGYFSADKPIVTTEIGNRVGDEAARAAAQSQINKWVANSKVRQETRQAYAEVINHEKNSGRVTPQGRLLPRNEISAFLLPAGGTVAEAVVDLQGKYFSLTVQFPVNGVMSSFTTRVVRNIAELADAIAPAFVMAKREQADLSIVSVNRR
jgi:hypothetical protein